ncbi:50S ribosomal protein L6 [Candidatus Neptunochlamydia vexilliferae]|uniref:Large ribosomal subunit protein uL6 n=1 Tax=Candidatus Neptunichlamydia vexilliferae TaxID=1651774 RepID=A0ABS0AXL3_9BACT|nr:50S ribosomal protein L6 [Candidatus Neptunochlamydia vexilliferae]MBF5058868.1 50S ribosomal protein L6 [Candidatus Neptunochlamydia vexilliferae]
MSRLGKAPIPLPKGVEVKVSKEAIEVKGPKGTLKHEFPLGISVKVEEDQVHVLFDEKAGLEKPHYGLHRSLINNAVVGVSAGFEKQLSLIGVGYRAAVKGNVLDLQLGFSHPSQVAIPADLQVTVEKNTLIKVTGPNKQVVGQFAANVRALRPPEPYKGKGVRYVDEYVRKKAGKSAKGS